VKWPSVPGVCRSTVCTISQSLHRSFQQSLPLSSFFLLWVAHGCDGLLSEVGEWEVDDRQVRYTSRSVTPHATLPISINHTVPWCRLSLGRSQSTVPCGSHFSEGCISVWSRSIFFRNNKLLIMRLWLIAFPRPQLHNHLANPTNLPNWLWCYTPLKKWIKYFFRRWIERCKSHEGNFGFSITSTNSAIPSLIAVRALRLSGVCYGSWREHCGVVSNMFANSIPYPSRRRLFNWSRAW
jgi:hypothetical protein